MNSLQRLIQHSGAKTQHFWFGLLGKVVTELIGLLIWLLLFRFLLSFESLSFTVMLLIALSLVLAQWIVGQSTKLSFLGAYQITHQLRQQLLNDIRLQPLAALRGQRLGEKVKLLTSDLKQFEDIFSHLLTEFVATWVAPMVMIAVLAIIQPWLAITLVLIFGLAFSVLVRVEGRFSHQADHTHQSNVQSSSLLLSIWTVYLCCAVLDRVSDWQNHSVSRLKSKRSRIRIRVARRKWCVAGNADFRAWPCDQFSFSSLVGGDRLAQSIAVFSGRSCNCRCYSAINADDCLCCLTPIHVKSRISFV